MKNRIQINLGTDHTLESTEQVIGRAGEGLVSRLEITVPNALSGYDAYIDFEKPNGETLRTPKLEVEYGVAYYDVPHYLLVDNGEIKVQLVFEKANGNVWKSSKKRYTILKSINASDDIPEKEDFISVAQKLIDELSQEVEEIAELLANDYNFAQAVIDACGGQRKIITINGIALRFFVGTQAEYDELGEGEKLNLFAIITDDTTKDRLFAEIDDLRSIVRGLQLTTSDVTNGKPYYLNGLESDNVRYITDPKTFDIDALNTVEDLGVYAFPSDFFKGSLTGFPTTFPTATGGKLIVEADVIKNDGTLSNVHQTLIVNIIRNADPNEHTTYRYYRSCRNGKWAGWERFVSVEDIEGGYVTAKKATNAENATHADSATNAEHATIADNAGRATWATASNDAEVAERARNDAYGNEISTTYSKLSNLNFNYSDKITNATIGTILTFHSFETKFNGVDPDELMAQSNGCNNHTVGNVLEELKWSYNGYATDCVYLHENLIGGTLEGKWRVCGYVGCVGYEYFNDSDYPSMRHCYLIQRIE